MIRVEVKLVEYCNFFYLRWAKLRYLLPYILFNKLRIAEKKKLLLKHNIFSCKKQYNYLLFAILFLIKFTIQLKTNSKLPFFALSAIINNSYEYIIDLIFLNVAPPVFKGFYEPYSTMKYINYTISNLELLKLACTLINAILI